MVVFEILHMMNIRKSSASAPDLVAAVSGDLTPTERRIAEKVLAEPTLLAFGTVSDLASRVGTSRPTIVRFANKLGFDGYTQLQRHVRSDLSHRLARPSERIRYEEGKTPPAKTAINKGMQADIHFWDDADGRKYHKAYFDVYPVVWRHGDYIEINERG